MRSYLVGFAVLWVWAGGALALESLEQSDDKVNKPNRRTNDGISPRQPSSSPFGLNKNLHPRQELNDLPDPNPNGLQMISFNVQPDVYNNDPVALRKNPTRLHQEYFCYWRTPKEGFNAAIGYGALTSYLRDYPTERCNGPGGFCTPVYCNDNYIVAVCNWGDTPWSLPCYDVVTQARDILVAAGNRDMSRWDIGFTGRSERQKINDRKKMCIPHASVWTPEMIGYTWFNANPHFQVQLYYGFNSDIFGCTRTSGRILDLVVADAPLSQEEYLDKWYGVPLLNDTDSTDTSGGSNPKPGAPMKTLNGTRTSDSSKSGTLPLPLENSVPGYVGPNLKDYNPIDSIPPQELAGWKWQQQLKSLGVSQSKSATASPPQKTGKAKIYPDWYSKSFQVIPSTKAKTRAYGGGWVKDSSGTSTSMDPVAAEETGTLQAASLEEEVTPTSNSPIAVKTGQGTAKTTGHNTVTTPAPTRANDPQETETELSTDKSAKGDGSSKLAGEKTIKGESEKTGEGRENTARPTSTPVISQSVPAAATTLPPSAPPTTIVTSIRNKPQSDIS
ncbi:hypothetical protein AA313_de0203504 [Arthrobotrys entomopaga]|nr:hypothetical protein AA313_de0203504 [Arthrobotrys entomopaga]